MTAQAPGPLSPMRYGFIPPLHSCQSEKVLHHLCLLTVMAYWCKHHYKSLSIGQLTVQTEACSLVLWWVCRFMVLGGNSCSKERKKKKLCGVERISSFIHMATDTQILLCNKCVIDKLWWNASQKFRWTKKPLTDWNISGTKTWG